MKRERVNPHKALRALHVAHGVQFCYDSYLRHSLYVMLGYLLAGSYEQSGLLKNQFHIISEFNILATLTDRTERGTVKERPPCKGESSPLPELAECLAETRKENGMLA